MVPAREGGAARGAYRRSPRGQRSPPVVEVSSRDDFWAAKPREDGAFVGANVLGRLWTEIREELRRQEAPGVTGPKVDGCLLLGEPVRSNDWGQRSSPA
jgi:hypothetical protein